MCPTVRQRTRHSSSSRPVLWSQRHHHHHHHHHQRIGIVLMVWERPLTNEEPYYQVAVFDGYDGEESTAQKGLLRPEKGRKLRRSQRLYGHDGKGVPKFRVTNRVRIRKIKRLLKRLHGELERRDLHDTQGSSLRSARVPIGR